MLENAKGTNWIALSSAHGQCQPQVPCGGKTLRAPCVEEIRSVEVGVHTKPTRMGCVGRALKFNWHVHTKKEDHLSGRLSLQRPNSENPTSVRANERAADEYPSCC